MLPRRLRSLLIVTLLVAVAVPLAWAPAAAADRAGRTTAGAPLPAAFVPPPEWSGLCDSVGKRGTPLVRGMNCRYLKLDGVFRRWVVQVPRNTAFPLSRRWPVVMMIHGSSATGERMLEKTNWPAIAEREGVVMVYPTAWRYFRLVNKRKVTRWNSYTLKSEIDLKRRLDGYPRKSPYPARDILFLQRVMADLDAELRLDRRQIHAAGSSQGGRFISRLAVEMGDTFASMSCMGWCDAPPKKVEVPRRVSILYGIGSRDDLVLKFLRQRRPSLAAIPVTWPEAWPVLKPLVRGHQRAWRLPDEPAAVNEGGTRLTLQWRAVNKEPRWITRFKVIVFSGITHLYPAPWSNPAGLDFAEIAWEFYRDNPMPPS
jgi:poly(3-hydroxybutyrate) depolymerase